jgi:hypothetical protein
MNQMPRVGLLDYRLQRFLVGLIAFTLPPVVTHISKEWLTSISASYYAGGRNMFVGMLFMVATFLIAYKGKGKYQPIMSKIAAFAAAGVALFPTTQNGVNNLVSNLHYSFAAVLFSILIYFCYCFYKSSKEKGNGKQQITRRVIYAVCATVMSVSMLVILFSTLFVPPEICESLRITFWGETAALEFFGIAWLVAGKWRGFGFLLEDKNDSFRFIDCLKNVEVKERQ